MPVLELHTTIDAPIERVFDLSRSIDLHRTSMAASEELAVAGKQTGLIGLDESVTWKARHFGVWFTLESRVVQLDRPHHFRDSMERGPFKGFDHDHCFATERTKTIVRDVFDYTSPFSLLGRIVDRWILADYMRQLLDHRNEVIKSVAESDRWQDYLGPKL